jgi:hypothetical protein
MRKTNPISILEADQRFVLDRPAILRAKTIHSYSDRLEPLLAAVPIVCWRLLTEFTE